MECPNCHHQASPTSLVKCSHCGESFERQILEEYEHLHYLILWLNEHREPVGKNADSLLADLKNRQARLQNRMRLAPPNFAPALPAQPERPAIVEPVTRPLAAQTAAPEPLIKIASPQPIPATLPAQAAPPPAVTVSGPVAQPVPSPLPAPSTPPSPPVDWGKIWDNAVNFVVSGALLRALLYMGAFMIVVSAAVLVINFWNIFPPILQIAFIFALPSAFYAGGWLTRARLKLEQAGIVLTGTGAVLLAVDFAALYQFTHLTIDTDIYWLFASLLTSAIYVFTAYRMDGEFFDYLMLLGGLSSLLALTRVLHAPLEWTLAAVPLAAAGMAGLAGWLWSRGDFWRDTARAARFLPQVITPLSLAVVLFVGGPQAHAGRMAAFLCAALAYGLLAWKFPSVWQLAPALISLAAALGFAVRLVDASSLWLASAGSLLAAVYIFSGQRFFSKETAPKGYRLTLQASGFVLSLAVFIASLILIGMEKRLQAAIPLTVLALSFCAWSLMLRRPLFGFIGSALALLPFWIWLDLAQVRIGFVPLAYLLLIACFHLPSGILIRRVDKTLAEPFEWTGWAVSGLIFFFSFLPALQSPAWAPALTLTLLTVYTIFNAWHFRFSAFAWATALVFPLAMMLWLAAWNLPSEVAALVWAGLAFVYLFAERLLAWSEDAAWAALEFRLPFGLGTVALGVIALVVALIAYIQLFESLNRLPLTLLAQGLLVALTVLAARLQRSKWPLFVEPLLSALLALFFCMAYSPSLFGRALEWFEYGLVFCALAWLHLLAAAGLDRLQTRYAHGLYLGGYGLAALAVLGSITHLPTLLWTLGGLLLALLGSALLTHFNRHHTWADFAGLFSAPGSPAPSLARSAFLWPLAWLFPIWCMLLLMQLNISILSGWLGASLAALLYLLVGEQLAKRGSGYSEPFFSAAHCFVPACLIFSLNQTLFQSVQTAFGLHTPPQIAGDAPGFIAQGLVQLAATLFYAIWAWLKGRRFFAHVTAWLSILSFSSLLFILQRFSAEQVVIAWTAWAGLLLLAGFLLDRLPKDSPRHAHGPYLAGYLFGAAILLVSLQDRWLNIVVLGIFLIFAALSALAVHFNLHRTWDDFTRLFGAPGSPLARLARGAFLWPLAWLFPLWCAQILIQQQTPYALRWLALSLPAMLYLPLGKWLARQDETTSRPFYSAAHVYILIAFGFSVDAILSVMSIIARQPQALLQINDLQTIRSQGLVQLAILVFYTAWAWMNRQRFFAHIAAWLSILPFSSLLLSQQRFTSAQIVIAWAGWAILLLVIGFLLDRAPKDAPRHAHGPYLAGYALALIALMISIPERSLNISVLGMCILAAALSFVSLHFKLHRTFEDFIGFFWRPGSKDTLICRGARLIFLFFAVYGLPVWILQLETINSLSIAWQGVSLALLAPLLIAAGLFLRRANPDYTWPFYSAGYALTALGALLAFADQRLAIYVLSLNVVVYAASARIFRQPFWLYLATCLAPFTVLLTLHYNEHLTTQWVAWAFTAFAFLYFGLGQLLERRKESGAWAAPFAMPLYAPGYLLSATALALVSADRSLALVVYPANILLYALSAWRLHEDLFLYPVAWLSIVPYYLFVSTYLPIPYDWQALAWLPLILVFIGLGRFLFHRRPLNLKSPRAIFGSLHHPAVPFYSIAYALTVTMILGARSTPLVLTVALSSATLLYFASALLFRHPAWLYPTLFTAHLSILAYFSIHPSDNPARFITFPFLALTWLEALAGYFVSRRYPVTEMTANGRLVFKFFGREYDFGAFPSIGYLLAPSWAQPIFIVVAIDTLLWESLALSGLDTGVWVSGGYFALFALFASLWQDQLLAYLALGFGSLTAGLQMRARGASIAQVFAGLSGVGLGLYLLSWLAEWLKGRFGVWRAPLSRFAILLSALGLVVTLPLIFMESIPAALALGFAGALYLTLSLRQRTYLLGYLGMGLLLAGWSLLLFKQNVNEPQFYALPAGLYFAGMGFFERLRKPGGFALIIESLGLAFLLVTSFIQSVNGQNGFPYFLLLIAEGLLVVWWGAARHLRVPFVIGLVASVLNVLAQVVVLVRVYDVNRWIIIFGVGILIVGLGLFMERRREMLLTRSQEFRDMLERWD